MVWVILMKTDIKLMWICFVTMIISGLGLLGCLSLQKFCILNDVQALFTEYGIWLLAGVCASSILLFITKIFDYKSKKNDLLIDFLHKTYELTNILSNVPTGLNNEEKNQVIKFYAEIDDTRPIWRELQNIISKLQFTFFSKRDKNIVDEISKFYADIYPVYIMNSIIYEKAFTDAGSNLYVKNSLDKLFDKKTYKIYQTNFDKPGNKIEKKTIEYWPKVYTYVVPRLKDLEKLLRKKKSGISERKFANDSYVVDPDVE